MSMKPFRLDLDQVSVSSFEVVAYSAALVTGGGATNLETCENNGCSFGACMTGDGMCSCYEVCPPSQDILCTGACPKQVEFGIAD